MKLEPLDGARFGARVEGCDLARLGSEDAHALTMALATHGLLLLRGQALNDPEIVAVLAALGEPDHGVNPATRSRHDERIIYVSNLKDENGQTIGGQGQGDLEWHLDDPFRDGPTLSFLYCLLAPRAGGDTCFASGRLGHRALPEELRRRVAGLEAVYPVPAGARRDVTRQRLPVVRWNPTTETETLCVSRQAESIEGLDPSRGLALIDELVAIQTREELVVRHRWKAGDVLIYDNGQVLHRRDAFEGLRFMKAARALTSPRIYPWRRPPA